MGEVDVGQVLDDDVEALVAGEVHQLFLVGLVVVVENLENILAPGMQNKSGYLERL